MPAKVNEQSKSETSIGNDALSNPQLLQILIDTMTDYSIVMLDQNGKVVSWSPVAERLTGYSATEVIGKDFSFFYLPEDITAGKIKRELEVAAREGRFEDEGWRIRKDGSKLWVNMILTALRNEKGGLHGFGRITRDLTPRRMAEERIKEQTKEIMEMATVPIAQVWEGILLVPLIGMLDSVRTQQLMERLLQRITESRSQVALLDITYEFCSSKSLDELLMFYRNLQNRCSQMF